GRREGAVQRLRDEVGPVPYGAAQPHRGGAPLLRPRARRGALGRSRHTGDDRRAARATEAARGPAAAREGASRLLRAQQREEPRRRGRGAAGGRRHGMTFTTRMRYRFGDIDDAGIAYYPKLLHYFHCAYEDWWSDALHHPYPKLLHDDALGLPAVKLEAEFFAPIRYGDEPLVHLGVLRVGDASVEFGMWMTKDGSGKPLCRARITTA